MRIAIFAILTCLGAGCSSESGPTGPSNEEKAFDEYLEDLGHINYVTREPVLLNEINSVIGENYTSDADVIVKYEVILPQIADMISDLNAVDVTESKLRLIHRALVSAWNGRHSFALIVLDAARSGDDSRIAEANGIMVESDNDFTEYVVMIEDYRAPFE